MDQPLRGRGTMMISRSRWVRKPVHSFPNEPQKTCLQSGHPHWASPEVRVQSE